MSLSILEAISQYQVIHTNFSLGVIIEAVAITQLEKLSEDCKNAGIVFSPKADDLYQHGQFEITKTVDADDGSSEPVAYEEDYEESSSDE